MCKCGLKAQWSTQPRASEATPWVPPCWSSRALKGQKHYYVLWTFTRAINTKRKQQTLPLMGATRLASGKLKQKLTDRSLISAHFSRRETRRPH